MVRNRQSFFSVKVFTWLIWLLIGGLFLVSAYGLFSGDRSLWAWLDLRQQNNRIQQQIEALETSKQGLEALTNRLHPHTLQQDYVEELVRQQLPYGRAGDVIIFLPQTEQE